MNGEGRPNKRKGRLNNSTRRLKINCEIKKSTPIRKPSNVPSTENRPRLSPAGNRLTSTARIKRKNRLYIPHCFTRSLDETEIRNLCQWVCNDIKRLRLSSVKPKTK